MDAPKNDRINLSTMVIGLLISAVLGHLIESPFNKANRSDEDVLKTLKDHEGRLNKVENKQSADEVRWITVDKTLTRIEEKMDKITTEYKKTR